MGFINNILVTRICRMLRFIHIGKTGGSTINKILRKAGVSYREYHLNKSYKNSEKYIIWLRNPLSRFVSAFNYTYHLVTYDCRGLMVKDINKGNCLHVGLIVNKIYKKNNFVFNPEYDRIIKIFKTPNEVAEALSSDNNEIRNNALLVMNYDFENIHRGIGWYLNNGDFVKNPNRNIIFIGKQETMKQDIKKLSNILKVKLNTEHTVRKNVFSPNESKYLSPLAIQNLIEFYKDSDYAALKELNKYGWITDEVLASYYTYP